MPGEESKTEAPGKIIYLGACLIAAVRLAREEKWDNSPRVVSSISDSIQLAQRIWERVKREFSRRARLIFRWRAGGVTKLLKSPTQRLNVSPAQVAEMAPVEEPKNGPEDFC
jgi:hypothetical protein